MNRFLDKDPHLKLAEKYVQQGKYSAAIDEYRKVLASQPNDIVILNTIGDVCARAGRFKEAIQQYRRVAQAYEDDGQIVKAIAMYKKIGKLDPAEPEAALKLADLLCRQGLLVDACRQCVAVAEANRGNEFAQQALRTMRRISEIDPRNVAIQLEFAKNLQAFGFPKEAQAAYIHAGQELARQGRSAESVEILQRGLGMNSGSKLAIKTAAELLAKQGKVESAVTLLSDQLASAPNDPELLIVLGRVYLNAAKMDEAEATFDRLYHLDASKFEYLLGVGRCFVELDQFDRAISIVDRCLEPMLARRERTKGIALLGEILNRDADNVEALQRLVVIYSRSGDQQGLLTSLTSLAEAASRRDRTEDARDALQMLIEMEPNRQAFRDQLARLNGGHRSGPLLPVLEPTPVPAASTQAVRASMLGPPTEASRARAEETDSARRRQAPHPEEFHSYATYNHELEIVEVSTRDAAPLPGRVKALEDTVARHPENLESRLELKQAYIEHGLSEKAAAQCLKLASLYENRGETQLAGDLVSEAHRLDRKPHAVRAGTGSFEEPTRRGREMSETNVANLRQFDRDFEREWRRAARDARSLALLKIMVDRFEEYMETYGQLGGEYSLERVSAVLQHALRRPADVLSKCGGGAFLAILPETDERGAKLVAERIRSEVECLQIAHDFSRSGEWVTVSVGLASATPRRKTSSGTMIVAVDDALLQAKLAGGNRIAVAHVAG
jgi:diguanylate cyclase (GGDEF)-like protein